MLRVDKSHYDCKKTLAVIVVIPLLLICGAYCVLLYTPLLVVYGLFSLIKKARHYGS